MNYAQIKANNVKLLLVDEKQAGAMCGKVTVFRDLCARYGLKPLVNRHSCKLWSAAQIEKAVIQLELERKPLS
jgi:hypothetical protein